MSKRRNENGQMRREEYEAAEDDVSADSFEIGFQRASEESIRKRKIVKARVNNRPVATAPKAIAATEEKLTNRNPFGDFQGLTTAKPSAPSNPFAGFSGLTSITNSGADDKSNSSSTEAAGSYQQAIEGLNKEFVAFVNGQAQKNPSASWVSSVQDYLKYAGEIATKHASTKPVAINEAKRVANSPFSLTSAPASAIPTPAAPSSSDEPSITSGFSFGTTAVTKAEPAKTSKSDGFSFGIPAKTDDDSAKSPSRNGSEKRLFGGNSSSLFSSKPIDSDEKTTPAFSFGALPKPAASDTATPASGFSFGSVTASNSSLTDSTGGFSFGALASTASTSIPAATIDEDDENIGREEATVIIKAGFPDDDCMFEAEKTKIYEFKKDEMRWADKGVHPLKVLVNKETKSARILVRNEIGKIVLNAALYKGIAIRPHELNGKKTGVTLALQVDDGELTQFLLKVNATRVDEFIKALESAAG